MTKSDQCPKSSSMSQLFPLYRMGINKFFDTCKQLAEHMRVTSWCPRLTVYKATVDPRTKQILCLQYELLHITFWKAPIALHFVGTNSTLQAFQRRKDYRTFTVTPSWVQMEARRIHCGSWEVKTPAYRGLWHTKTFHEQDDSYRWFLGGIVLCQALHQIPADLPWAPRWLYVALECCWVCTVKLQIWLLQWSCSWLASIANKVIQLFFREITRSTTAVNCDDSSKVECLIFLPYFQCLFCHMKCL